MMATYKNTKQTGFFAGVLLGFFMLVLPQVSLAQDCPTGSDFALGTKICVPNQGGTGGIGISDKSVGDTITDVTKFLAGLIGVLAILFIVFAGIMYITSSGDTSRIERAKQILVYAIIGLIVALLAWVIVSTVSGALGAGGGTGLPPGDPCIYDPNC